MTIRRILSIGGKPNARERAFSLSDRGILLAVAGALGVVLSLGLAMTALANVISLPVLAALLIYVVGVVALMLLTAGEIGPWTRWSLRLGAPLPAALLVWAGLAALGL